MRKIDLSVGSGGKSMHEFIGEVILKHLGSVSSNRLGDSAILNLTGPLGFSTDSFVIHPLFFPGGDIGKLAVAGTVNDLVVSGVRPRYLSLALIIEEGFSLSDMEKILASISETAAIAKVLVVTGDTKVVRKKEADGLFINSAGLGEAIKTGEPPIKEGDAVIVTGSPGDHGVAIMLARRDFSLTGEVLSDCLPLVNLLPLWELPGVKWMRDITRGGLAGVLWEFGHEKDVTVLLEETKIPYSPPVKSVAEILGIDPLYLPSEGKAVIVVASEAAAQVLNYLQQGGECPNAAIIGKVRRAEKNARLILKTCAGGYRLLEPLTGELLPRIC